MEQKKIDRLQILLRQVELPAPPDGFTEGVMQETAFLETEQTPVNDRLRKVLREGHLTEPPTNFTYNVQQGISVGHQVIKPVIGRGVWISVGLFMGVCVVMALTYPTHNTPTATFLYSSWLADRLISWTSAFRAPILYFDVIVLTAGALLGLEKILRRGINWRHA
ncbi:MAG TPA: hypothetical protein VK658_17620 [Chryseolinea sp.]|nr:hypothetical protein [Chryseolinea sp.]